MNTKKIKQKCKPVDKQLIKNWKIKMFDTTYDVIAASTDLSTRTVGEAIRTGKATQNTIDALTKYFNEMEVTA